MRRLVAAASTIALSLTALVPGMAQPAAAATLTGEGLTAVVPDVRQFTPASGAAFFLKPTTRIIVQHASLADEAELLADELVALDLTYGLGLNAEPTIVSSGTPVAGDIVLSVGAVSDVSSDQGYSIVVDGHATISGPTDQGAFYGTRTLLQSLVLAGGAEAGTVIDEPTVEVRSLHVDGARKYFSPEWYEEQFRQMSWVKLNQLQYHFSENEGFRLESTSHPEIVSDEYLTKAELTELIELAARYHIEIVPALDLPGHLAQALRAHPEWAASQTDEGLKILDYSKPEARAFITDLIDEYAPLFPSTSWHLGADEVFDLYAGAHETRFPNLHQYAKDNVGATANVLDGYVHYVNTVAEYLNGKGKDHVRAWNDAMYTPGSTVKLNQNVDVAYWTRWHESFPALQTIIDNGHRVINFNDAYFYYVLTSPGRAYFTKPTAQKIYTEWTPGRFPGRGSSSPQIISNDHESLLGASFAIWNDEPDQETERQVADGIKDPLRAMASRSWNAASTATYAQWATRAAAIGDAPQPTIPVAPELTVDLTATPAGDVDPGTTQAWELTLNNAGESAAPADLRADLTQLAGVADVSGLTTTLLDGTGRPVLKPGTNVARGGTPSASGQELPDRWGPANAIDGDLGTRFSSNESDSAWFAVELAEPTVVDHVNIRWELAAARFKLQTSVDGVVWTDATAELQAAVGSVSTVELNTSAPVKAVRMQAIERTPAVNGLKYGVALYEFEVWDGPEEGLDVPAASIVDGALTLSDSIQPGHTLVLSWDSTVKASAPAGQTFTVTATVDSPFFPAVSTDQVSSRVRPAVKPTPKPTPTPTPTKPAPTKPTTFQRTAPYTLAGLHKGLNGRDWNTVCEPYSQTERCRTDIWATVVLMENGQFVRKSGWTFNNLTYLPYMTREAWGTNPLGSANEWTAATDGRMWRTECDTVRSGRNGCRSYTHVTVYTATAKATGGYTFSQGNEWVFNNIVMLGGPHLR